MTKLLTTSLTLTLAALSAQATTFNINSNSADQQYSGGGAATWVGQSTARIGTGSADGSVFVMVFELPTLAEGETISTSNLDFYLDSSSNLPSEESWNIDLYGVRTSNSATVQSTDFFMDANDASATKLEDNILAGMGTAAPTTGTHSTSIAGDTALTDWLNSLYSGNTPIATYAFIRLNGDLAAGDMTNSRYVTIQTGDGTNAPVLQINTSAIPESSSYAALLGFSALGFAMLRRRHA